MSTPNWRPGVRPRFALVPPSEYEPAEDPERHSTDCECPDCLQAADDFYADRLLEWERAREEGKR